jgi:hypothetical protein
MKNSDGDMAMALLSLRRPAALRTSAVTPARSDLAAAQDEARAAERIGQVTSALAVMLAVAIVLSIAVLLGMT